MINLQDLFAVCVVLLAAVYLVWRLLRIDRRGGPPGCGECPRCPTRDDEQNELISLDPPEEE